MACTLGGADGRSLFIVVPEIEPGVLFEKLRQNSATAHIDVTTIEIPGREEPSHSVVPLAWRGLRDDCGRLQCAQPDQVVER